MTQKLIVGAALLDRLSRPKKLLVARRSAPAELAGLWEFPGGKVEAGELPEEALLRELREELGIEAVLGAELVRSEQEASPLGWPLQGDAVMRLWLAEVSRGVPAPLQDHDELRWQELNEPEALLALPWIPADFPIVAELLRVVGH